MYLSMYQAFTHIYQLPNSVCVCADTEIELSKWKCCLYSMARQYEETGKDRGGDDDNDDQGDMTQISGSS